MDLVEESSFCQILMRVANGEFDDIGGGCPLNRCIDGGTFCHIFQKWNSGTNVWKVTNTTKKCFCVSMLTRKLFHVFEIVTYATKFVKVIVVKSLRFFPGPTEVFPECRHPHTIQNSKVYYLCLPTHLAVYLVYWHVEDKGSNTRMHVALFD